MPRKNWSDKKLEEAYNKHCTIRGIARELGIGTTNNFEWLKGHLSRVGLIDKAPKKINRWEDDDLIAAVKQSHSVKETCKRLNRKPYDKKIRARMRALELDTSHFFALNESPKHLFKRYCSSEISMNTLRRIHKKCLRVGFKLGFLEKKCFFCKKNKEILHLHHLDVDLYNNLPQNVVVVCDKCK